ncbi:MAG TPA: TolC family protein [Chitinophagaceae bacterium]
MKFPVSAVIYILIFILKGNAQQIYSLEDCFNIARRNNIAILKSRNDLQSAILDKKAANNNLLPSLSAGADHYFFDGKSIDPVTNNYINDDFTGGSLGMSVDLNIFSGFTALNSIKANLYKLKASDFAYRKTELEILSAVTIAYAKAMYSREQVIIKESNGNITKHELDVTNEQITVGKLSKSEYYIINARYTSESADLIEARNDSLSAMNELKYLLGLDSPINITGINEIEINNIISKNFISADVVTTILQKHPALLESVYMKKAGEMNLKVARGSLYPNISVNGNLFSNYNNFETDINGNKIPLGKQLDNNFGNSFGIVVQVPIFSKFQNSIAIKKEKINVLNAELSIREVKNDISKNSEQLVNDFIAAKQKYILQAAALEQSKLSYHAYEEKHQLSRISSVELITAKDQLYSQQAKYAQAKYDLYFKYKLIELLMSM